MNKSIVYLNFLVVLVLMITPASFVNANVPASENNLSNNPVILGAQLYDD